MQQVFVIGDEPVPGYRLTADLGGSAFYKMWKVSAPDGSSKLWKVIDLVVGNAAIETRTLGLLVQLRHPFLNTLTNFWQLDDGKTLIVETDVPLFSLREQMDQCKQRGETLPREELMGYLEQAAEGLDFLNSPRHEFQGSKVAIYHRALRPECLLVFEEGGRRVCKVSDFGLSKPVTEEVAQHSQGLLHYDYDPPEFFEGQTASTSDQYALAINYYEMRTGVLPFTGTMLQQLQARLNDNPDLSLLTEPERAVVRRALARDPRGRYENCAAFARAIKAGRLAEGMAVAGLGAGIGTSATWASGQAGTPLAAGRGEGANGGNNGAASASRVPTPASRSGSLASFGIDVAARSGPPLGVPPRGPRPEPVTQPAAALSGPIPRPAPSGPRPGPLSPRPASMATAAVAAPVIDAPRIDGTAPKPAKDMSNTNLRLLRSELSGVKKPEKARDEAADFSLEGEKRIPVAWVVVVLFVVMGTVYAALSLIP